MLGHVVRTQQPLVSGAIRGIFTAGSAAEARERLGQVVDQLRPHAPKVARLLEDAEADLLAFYAFPAEHWSKLRSTNPLDGSMHPASHSPGPPSLRTIAEVVREGYHPARSGVFGCRVSYERAKEQQRAATSPLDFAGAPVIRGAPP
jgi:hypothetical protein